jgi:hypothetical protein
MLWHEDTESCINEEHHNLYFSPSIVRMIFRLELREYGSRDLSLWPRGTLYPQKLALTLQSSGGRSVGIVRLRTKATE